MNPNLKKLAAETKNPDLEKKYPDQMLVISFDHLICALDLKKKRRQIIRKARQDEQITAICLHQDRLLYTVAPKTRLDEIELCDVVTGEKVDTFSRRIENLASFDGQLYDAGVHGLYRTLNNKYTPVNRHQIWSICRHEKRLCCSIPEYGICDALTGEKIADDNVVSLCSNDGDLFGSFLDTLGIYNLSAQKMEKTTKDYRPIKMCSHMGDIYYVLVKDHVRKAMVCSAYQGFKYDIPSKETGGLCSVPKKLLQSVLK
jgi:hypothetical protein